MPKTLANRKKTSSRVKALGNRYSSEERKRLARLPAEKLNREEGFVAARQRAGRGGNGGFNLNRKNRNGLTLQQERYAERLVYGGETKRLSEWAEVVGVSTNTIVRWHKEKPFVERVNALQAERREAMQRAMFGKVMPVIEQLERIIQMDPTYEETKYGKDDYEVHTKRADAKIVEQQRLAIQDFFALLGMSAPKDDRQTLFHFQQVVTNYHAAGGDKSEAEIRRELLELRALEPGEPLDDDRTIDAESVEEG